MFDVVLYQPEIPPNTGNIIRLCANTGVRLHLIEPLGFDLDDARLRRAGLDYREYAEIAVHASLDECLSGLGQARVLAISTRGGERYDRVSFQEGDAILLGPETRGLPARRAARLTAKRVPKLSLPSSTTSQRPIVSASPAASSRPWSPSGDCTHPTTNRFGWKPTPKPCLRQARRAAW